MLFCGTRAELVSGCDAGELVTWGESWRETAQNPKPSPIAIAASAVLLQNRAPPGSRLCWDDGLATSAGNEFIDKSAITAGLAGNGLRSPPKQNMFQ